jgi:hypothetical protein
MDEEYSSSNLLLKKKNSPWTASKQAMLESLFGWVGGY